MNRGQDQVGCVYLMGAGPSDPALLTCRARELLASCDVVAYDALVAPVLLNEVAFPAELISVGYRGHDGRRPFGMHPLVLERALAGKSVARLKSGDPAVFSRIAQEVEDLVAHGIPYEILPGISSANAAAAYLDMPLTRRDLAADVTFVSGHDLHSRTTQQSDWSAIVRMTGTVVIYMGATKLAQSCAKLIALGKPPATPAALVSAVGTPGQSLIRGTLGDLAERVEEAGGAKSPGIIVLGAVAHAHPGCGWLAARRPLFAQSVVWAGDGSGNAPARAALAADGLHIHAAYRVRRKEIAPATPTDQAFLARHDYFIFAQPAAVQVFLDRLHEAGLDLRALHDKRIIALGEATLHALRQRGVRADGYAEELAGCDALEGTGVLFGCARAAQTYECAILRLGLRLSFVPLYDYEVRYDLPGPDGASCLVVAGEDAAHLLLADQAMCDRIAEKGAVALTRRAAAVLDGWRPALAPGRIVRVPPEELGDYLLRKNGAAEEGGC